MIKTALFLPLILGLLALPACTAASKAAPPTPTLKPSASATSMPGPSATALPPTATLPAPKPVRAVQGHPERSFVKITWSPDGRLLASYGNDNKVIVWDANTLEPVRTLDHGNTAFDVSVWDLQTNTRLTVLADTTDLTHAAWNAKGTLLAYEVYFEALIRFWAVPGSDAVAPEPVSLPPFDVGLLRWQSDGTLVATGVGENGFVHWRSTSPGTLEAAAGPSLNGIIYAYSPDGLLAASLVDLPVAATVSTADFGVVVWDTATGDLRNSMQSHDFYGLGGLAFSPDNALLAAAKNQVNVYAESNIEVRIWDLASHGLAAILPGGSSEFVRVAFSPDGKTLAAGEANGGIRLWELDAYLHPPVTPTPVPTLTPVPDSSIFPVFLTSYSVPIVYPQEPEFLNSLRWSEDGALQGSGYFAGALSPDGSKIAYWDRGDFSGPEVEVFGVYDAMTNTPLFQIPATEVGRGNEIAWAPDGSRVAVQTFYAIEVFDVPDAKRMTLENIVEPAEFPMEVIYDKVIWSSDGKWIVSNLQGEAARFRVIIWDAASGDIFRIYEQEPKYGGGTNVDHFAFSPDSSRLLLVKGNVEVLDVLTGELQAIPAGTGLSQFVGTGAWSSDGVYVAVDYREVYRGAASVLFWNTETGEVFILFTRMGESSANFNLVWAPDRPWLATIDGSDVYILDAENKSVIRMKPEIIATPRILSWSPHGSKLALGSQERTVEIWGFSK